jgi:hypothetical protein
MAGGCSISPGFDALLWLSTCLGTGESVAERGESPGTAVSGAAETTQ